MSKEEWERIRRYSREWKLNPGIIYTMLKKYHLDGYGGGGGPTGEKFEKEFVTPVRDLFCEQLETTPEENPEKWNNYMEISVRGIPIPCLITERD